MDRERKIRRSAGVLARAGATLGLQDMADGRDERGRRWRNAAPLMMAMLLGMLTGRKSLAETERLTEDLSLPMRRKLGIVRRVPDTTMRDLVMRTELAGPRSLLHRQTKRAQRSKALAPVGLPCGMASFDGKTVMTDLPDERFAQRQGDGRFAVRTMTCSLVSAAARPCIDVEPIPKEHNEMAWFIPSLQAVLATYAGMSLFELVSIDSGMTSKENADAVAAANLGYLMGLKGNQPELRAEAERLLGHLPASAGLSETRDWVKGQMVVRRVWLTAEMAGYHGWEHLRTVLRVQSEKLTRDGEVEARENRYFLSNEPHGRFNPAQWLAVVRAHWWIENGAHKTLDVGLEEDDRPWIRATHGLLVTQVLRRVAYNILSLWRNVSLRNDDKCVVPWKTLLEWIDLAVTAAEQHHLMGLRWEERSTATRA
jgi:predicted transposase YbfD/YdcC